MKKFSFPWILLLIMSLGFVACSKDTDQPQPDTDKVEGVVVIDELEYLQSRLVRIDKNGAFVERIMGVPLDQADTTEVSVGVDNLAQAKETFNVLFADTTQISENGTKATFTTREGSARFVEGNGKEGVIASIDFNIPGLKFVSKINFMLNSAWPNNASERGYHKLGVQYQMKAWTGPLSPLGCLLENSHFEENKLKTFVCVREYKNGVPALLVGISDAAYYLHWRFEYRYGGKIPNKHTAREISGILRSNWDYYKKCFNANDKSLLYENWGYWIREGSDYGVAAYRSRIILHTGDIGEDEVHWDEPRHRVLFYDLSGLKE